MLAEAHGLFKRLPYNSDPALRAEINNGEVEFAMQRIGDPYLRVDPATVVAVIETDAPDRSTPLKPVDDDSRAMAGLLDAEFENLVAYTDVIQDGLLDLLDAGKLRGVSATSFGLSEDGSRRLLENIDSYKGRILLRSEEISNHPEVRRARRVRAARLGGPPGCSTHPAPAGRGAGLASALHRHRAYVTPAGERCGDVG